MAVGPDTFPDMHPVAGFQLGTTAAEIKKPGRKDLVLMRVDIGATIAGVFTRNRFCAAPVLICQKHLQQQTRATECINYLITNTGFANAGTGPDGYENSLKVCQLVSSQGGAATENVFPFSTGVIGERLPVEKIEGGLERCFKALSEDGWSDAGRGIMTTDTRPKGASVQVDCAGKTVTVTGISKGAGMIRPNMATMLAYIATDAGVAKPLLDELLREAADISFNQATVDGDTSTNDSCMLVATNKADVYFQNGDEPGFVEFREALFEVCVDLAKAIVKDGEGATKFVTVKVSEARNRNEAREIAYTVAHSPLVKTALFAADPNWGRILAAIGRAPVDSFEVEKVTVYLDDVLLCEKGSVAESYVEEDCAAVMQQEEYTIEIRMGLGEISAEVWTCDFSYDYVKINADYRS
ncbi:MAG: bifunctional glutamate N-acetyltransferase/amino-acid acetyltransferase ArgJ [Ketobacteraceae bacterium]|nr:bifunctional glutamate N-acetyltransferase/amino-acid acetyltransferase ArgJ [Ketobacteraceae bacterium]